jgi:hypothetical protein
VFTGTFESLLFIACSSSFISFSKLSSSSSAAIINTSGSLSSSAATPEPIDTLSLASFPSSLSSAEESEFESSYLLNLVDTGTTTKIN